MRALIAARNAAEPADAVDRDVVHAAHERPADRMAEHRLLRHEAHQPPPRGPERNAGEGEVEVGDVVHDDDTAAVGRHVLLAHDVDAQVERLEGRQGDADDAAVQPLGHEATLVGRPVAQRGRTGGTWVVAWLQS